MGPNILVMHMQPELLSFSHHHHHHHHHHRHRHRHRHRHHHHLLYLNSMGFKTSSLWGRVKIISIRDYIIIGIKLLTELPW